MGILDFIKGKKKEESFEDNYSNTTVHNEDLKPAFSEDDLESRQPDLQPSVFSQTNNSGDIQRLLIKIELINQRLEVIDKRLQTIEKIAKESQ